MVTKPGDLRNLVDRFLDYYFFNAIAIIGDALTSAAWCIARQAMLALGEVETE
jgi:hypothetical protein